MQTFLLHPPQVSTLNVNGSCDVCCHLDTAQSNLERKSLNEELSRSGWSVVSLWGNCLGYEVGKPGLTMGGTIPWFRT